MKKKTYQIERFITKNNNLHFHNKKVGATLVIDGTLAITVTATT